MKLMLLLKVPFLGAFIAVCSSFQAQAQLEVRLSIKVILEANGTRPAGGTLSTDAGIRSSVTDANSLLASFGRGYQYRITEILDLPGHSELLDLGCQDASDAIEAGVQNNPVSYTYFARWLTSVGRTEEARLFAEAALKLSPADADARSLVELLAK